MNNVEKIVVLNSGGFDSVVMLHELRMCLPNYEIHTIFFDYGQPSASKERECAFRASMKLGCIHKEIKLPKFDWSKKDFYKKSISSSDQIVEMRNMVFLSYAVSYAESISAKEIYAAFMLGTVNYYDTSTTFVEKMNEVTEPIGIKIFAPYAELEKPNLANMAFYHNIKKHEFFSCNCPDRFGNPCGVCDDCLAIKNVMDSIRVDNAFKYFVRNNFNPKDGNFKKFLSVEPLSDVYLEDKEDLGYVLNYAGNLGVENLYLDFDVSKEEVYTILEEVPRVYRKVNERTGHYTNVLTGRAFIKLFVQDDSSISSLKKVVDEIRENKLLVERLTVYVSGDTYKKVFDYIHEVSEEEAIHDVPFSIYVPLEYVYSDKDEGTEAKLSMKDTIAFANTLVYDNVSVFAEIFCKDFINEVIVSRSGELVSERFGNPKKIRMSNSFAKDMQAAAKETELINASLYNKGIIKII